MEFIYYVEGQCRLYDGDINYYVIGVRRDKKDANELGHNWVVERNKTDKALSITMSHNSYNIYKLPLL